MQTYQVTFQPDAVKVVVEPGVTVMEAAQRGGIILNSLCGGAGHCRKCMVEIDGVAQPVAACQYHVEGDLTVTVPENSRFFEQKILEEGISRPGQIQPVVRKYFVRPAKPDLQDLRSDADRLIDTVSTAAGGNMTIAWPLLRQLPQVLRHNDYSVTAICHGESIFALEASDTTDTIFGMAVDVGTTTVVGHLVDLTSGKTTAIASRTNPQISLGEDVISRIDYSRTNPDGLGQLQRLIVDCLNRLIAEVCEKAQLDYRRIYEMTVAGNATMEHLLLGIPVEQIAQAPYVPAVTSAINVTASELGIDIHPAGNIFVMPGVAGHVGGDTVAVALATAMRHSKEINLALDIGTNGELVLGNKDRLSACSTAAGPAFEGARISHGMRGATGAIERVHINDDVEISVIGGGTPMGICGSGLIDAIAELLNVGIIDYSGKILTNRDLPEKLGQKLLQRIVEIDGRGAFVLAGDNQAKNGRAVVLTQRDIREAQLAKAAISTGTDILMQQMQIELTDIDRLYLAGAFGNYIRPESARRIGLLPDVPLEKIQFVGNAAAAGAREVLLSRSARGHAVQLAREIEYLELAGRSEFQTLFSENIFFPEK